MNLNKIKRISIGTFLVAWTAMYGSCIYNNHQESKIKEAEKIAKEQAFQEKKKQDLINKQKAKEEKDKKIEEVKLNFANNRNEILKEINSLIESNDLIKAKSKLDEYTKWMSDSSLKDLEVIIEIKNKEFQLKSESSLDRKIEITNDLIKISNDKKYSDLLKLLTDKKKYIERQKILEEIKKTDITDIDKNYKLYSDLYTNYLPLTENETKQMAYYMAEKTISDNRKLQFRRSDGSNILVVNFVKTLMNDPSSFEHIDTTVYKTDDKAFLDIVMLYRGKNAFGAKVVNTIKARVSLISNTILSIDNE